MKAEQLTTDGTSVPLAELLKGGKRRHPLEVTGDRLGDHYEKYYEQLSSDERNALGLLRQAFEDIAEGRRDDR